MKALLFVTAVVGLSFLFTSARSWSRRDWDYELQPKLVLGYLDCPEGG